MTCAEWVQQIARDPKGFKKKLKIAKSDKVVNDISGWAKSNKMFEIDMTFSCYECGYACESRQQLALHSFKMHSYSRRTRAFIDTEYCPVCLQHFGSRIKVINHLEEKSMRCRAVVLTCFPKLPLSVVERLDMEDAGIARNFAEQGRRRHHHDTFVERLSGPMPRGAILAGLSHKTLLKTPRAPVEEDIISRLCTACGPCGLFEHNSCSCTPAC